VLNVTKFRRGFKTEISPQDLVDVWSVLNMAVVEIRL